MPAVVRSARAARLPAYALYGEARAQALPDVLHCESIAERSRLHDWEIRPHRHESLFQFLHLRRGGVEATLDGVEHRLAGPCAITVPALTAHGFRFSADVDGDVFTIADTHLASQLAADAALRSAVLRARAWALQRGAPARAVQSAAQALRDEYRGHAAWRALAVDAALQALVVCIARHAPPDGANAERAPARALAHVQRFRALVESRFREQPALATMAGDIGITPTQLNRVCRRVLGHSALGVLHARLLLEAQRELAYTTMSVKQIALDLGFADAGYFTRFFQRGSGATPTAWRLAAATRDVAPVSSFAASA